jgi:hypothetical protein
MSDLLMTAVDEVMKRGGSHWGKKGINSFEKCMYDFMKLYFHVPSDVVVRSKAWLQSPFALLERVIPTLGM